eukprot:gnl/TRDRNA2_/TRDRNA2_195104_c0_seq1.p1 gnl/TRDRNA2_/TRDRNA2_195104_c0~~gnl/TRDRNA2_/TRDRNA2_195104_c0_seq1.p1  ORF type:complete len:244 (-),score=66.39 gnl/TRDRNA2_/TRDRNA2_195104_c0_seq1:138-776(-)
MGRLAVIPHEPEDPEEAEALAAMRAAFADDDVEAGLDFGKGDAGGGIDADAAPAEKEVSGKGIGKKPKKRPLSRTAVPKATSSDSAPVASAEKASARPQGGDHLETSQDGWLQGQVDRLVGEVQRRADGPFQLRLLKALWSLPLEDQHDVLLGATGTDLHHKDDSATKLWQLIQEEVRARGGWASTAAARGSQMAAPVEPQPSRSRSRSPSI